MPNHVTTICTVTGPAADVAAFAERHMPFDAKTERRRFDFNTVIPKPAVVDATTAGAQAERGLYALTGWSQPYDGPFAELFPHRNSDNPSLRWPYLPAHVTTREALLEYLKANDPEALEQGEKAKRCLEETGHPDWYRWSIENWDTKWNAYDYAERERSEGRFVFKFETAWSFPEKVFRKLAELHPTLTISVASFDEGGFGAEGEFNGKNDFRCDKSLATEELYERVYGRKPDADEEVADG